MALRKIISITLLFSHL